MSKTIQVEFYTDERDFIIDTIYYALLDDLLNKLKNAIPNKQGILSVSLDSFDLEQLIGNLSLEANHNKKRAVQDMACEIAERLESYEQQFNLKLFRN